MQILQVFKQLRDDLKSWVTNNLTALDNKIDKNVVHVDNELDSTSSNPVRNSVVTNAINSIPKFSGDYNDLTNAPNITEDDSGNIVIADESGNIIFKADANGMHTTSLTLNGESVTDIIDDKVASLVDSAPDTLNTLNELASALGDDPNFATTVATEIGKKVDKVDGKGLSTNDFTNDYKNTLDNLGSMAFNEVDPTVPAWAKEETKPSYTAEEVGALSDSTVLADLTEDANHRTVTDAEKSTWNAKSDFSGDYNDLQNAPNIVEDGEGSLVISDPNGNVIFRSDENGFETTQLITDTLIVGGRNVIDIGGAIVIEESNSDVYDFEGTTLETILTPDEAISAARKGLFLKVMAPSSGEFYVFTLLQLRDNTGLLNGSTVDLIFQRIAFGTITTLTIQVAANGTMTTSSVVVESISGNTVIAIDPNNDGNIILHAYNASELLSAEGVAF